LDFDEDAVWYTHFRSPFSLQDSIENQLSLEVSFLEKISPRIGSTDETTEKRKVTVATALLSEVGLIFKKKMKWIQIIGILTSCDQSALGSKPHGMYTVTMRYNPNATEGSPRSSCLPPPVVISSPSQAQIESPKDGSGPLHSAETIDEGHVSDGANAWPAEYEYDSYYHEGGYYDHHTHAYLGNAYDHTTAQYYHDENLLYDPQELEHGHEQAQEQGQWSEQEHQGQEQEAATASLDIDANSASLPQPLDEAVQPHVSEEQVMEPSNDLRDISPDDLYLPSDPQQSQSSKKELIAPLVDPPSSEPLAPPLSTKLDEEPAAPKLPQGSKKESASGAQLTREVGYFEVQSLTITKLKKIGDVPHPLCSLTLFFL
jgi:hypothetical protein